MSSILPFGSGAGQSRALARQLDAQLGRLDARGQIAHAQLLVVGRLAAQAANDAGNLTAQCVEISKQVPEAAATLMPILRTYAVAAQQIIAGSVW